MPDEVKPNHDYLKLAAKILAMLLTSGAVAKWIDGDTSVKVTGNTNVAAQGLHEATWAVNQIMELRVENAQLKQRVELLEKR
jgi:hypothetical protein